MSFQAILGNFALILFVLTIVTGIIWFLDVFLFSRQRRALADAALAEYDARHARLRAQGVKTEENGRARIESELLKQPTWIEYSGSFFPVIALVFFLRSFLYEPFKIPSSSMVPTLVTGDLILVNKYTYGIRLPIINRKIVELNNPERGDVMVFKYPKDPALDYIKRVVGVPGDRIEYRDKRLMINGQPAVYQALPDYLDEEHLSYSKQFREVIEDVSHRILNDERALAPAYAQRIEPFPHYEQCSYNHDSMRCTVPAGHYFVMGDNRDNSLDSRYWGFVPDENIVGKAFFVWMNLGDFRRIGRFQ
jgi:signal peptidase I